jgi:hypothetical protein
MVEIIENWQGGQFHNEKSAGSQLTEPALYTRSSDDEFGIGTLRKLLEYPDADFLGGRTAGFPELAPEPDEFLLLCFFHESSVEKQQNIRGTNLQDQGWAGVQRSFQNG